MIIGQEDLTRRRFAAGSRGADGRFVSSPTPDAPATATITTIGGGLLADGETFTIDDGIADHDPITFEFDENGFTGPGNVLIDITGAFGDPDADEMRDRIITAINGQTSASFEIAASDGGSGTVTVTHQIDGEAGNDATIAETVTDPGFSVTAFSGGSESTESEPFTGSLQPAPGKVLETLEEGERARGAFLLFTTTELRTADVATQTPADQVTRVSNGEQFEVREVHHWPALLAHYECVLLRIKESV